MNFDKVVKRSGTNSVKYDSLLDKFGKEDILPLWVADMDFVTSPAITEAMQKRIMHPIFGYSFYSEKYFQAIIDWYDRKHDFQISREEIVSVNNIASAVAVALEIFSRIGDEILIQTPLYPPFRETIIRHERVVTANPLQLVDGGYEIDWIDFEAKAKNAKMFLFCSPHNPTGRVWKEDEITKISHICKENNVIIISDEIHSDLTHKNYKHIPIASSHNQNIITLNSPAKRFNIPSIVNAYAIIKDEKLREKFLAGIAKYSPHTVSPLTEGITIAAYSKSDVWIDEIDKYLLNNLEFIMTYLIDITKIKAVIPQASFLLWLDCSDLNMNSDEIADLFVNKLKLGLNNGIDFGAEGNGFMRLNYGTPMCVLIEVINRLKLIDN